VGLIQKSKSFIE